jgi:hypothetical protein
MSIAEMTHLSGELLCLNAVLTLAVENYLICFVDNNNNNIRNNIALRRTLTT